jgi:uncharacterized protein YhfF
MKEPKPLKPAEQEFWNRYLATLDTKEREIAERSWVEANMAGSREITDALLALYLAGKKDAGSGLVKDYETMQDPLPKVGNHWIILDSNERPLCLVRTRKVEIHKFSEIPSYVAEAEGEGDLSVAYWKEAHASFFSPFLKRWGVGRLEEAEVVVEFFDVLVREG